TMCAGGNDMIRPGADPDARAVVCDGAVRRLRATGARVVIFTGFDTRGLRRGGRIRGKAATYNMHLRAIADRRGCTVVDLWPLRVFDDPRAWYEDRLHLSSEGHRRMALCVAETIGLPVEEDWRAPWPPMERPDWLTLRREDVRWARMYLLPWIGRRATGRSTGDGRSPKLPVLAAWSGEPGRWSPVSQSPETAGDGSAASTGWDVRPRPRGPAEPPQAGSGRAGPGAVRASSRVDVHPATVAEDGSGRRPGADAGGARSCPAVGSGRRVLSD